MNAMDFFTTGLLPVAISLMVLWVAYRLLFANSNRFQFNRFFLLTAMLFSLALPLFGLLMGQNSPQVVAFKQNLFEGILLNEITVTYGDSSVTTLPEIVITGPSRMQVTVWQVVGIIYLIGVAVTALLFLFKMGKLVAMIIRSPKRKMEGYTMVFTHREHGPYSFFRYAFFKDEQVDPTIVRHELSHIAHHHSWDILLVELMKIFQWFNPFIYFYKRELQSLHEYIADNDVVTAGADKRNYMMLILQQCTAADFSNMSNNFSLILTKKRIKMITRNEKARHLWWRLLATIPVLAVLLVANTRGSAQQMTKPNQTVDETKTSEITDIRMKGMDNDTIYDVVDQMPEYPGGMEMLMKYVAENVKYPEAAKEKNISGRVFVQFVIEKDGSVNEVKVLNSIGGGCDEEAVRVVKAMPNWKPGIKDGKPVRVRYNMPFNFKLDDAQPTKTDKKSVKNDKKDVKADENGVYTVPETMPEYPGGVEAMIAYFSENLTVPEKYTTGEFEYKLFVQFVVTEDGSVADVDLLKAMDSKQDLNDEAIRVVKSMPKWKPGTVDGKPVKVSYTLPIVYRIR